MLSLLLIQLTQANELNYTEGVVTRISGQGIGLNNGMAYLWATDSPPIFEDFDGSSISPSRIPVGSVVRIWLNSRNAVSRAFVFDKSGNIIKRPVEQSSLMVDIDRGPWRRRDNQTEFPEIRVKTVYAASGYHDENDQIGFGNDDLDDYFECYLAIDRGVAKVDVRVAVRVDGEQVYQTPILTDGTKPIKVTIPIRGKSAITFDAEYIKGPNHRFARTVMVGDPVVFKSPMRFVDIISPNTDEPFSNQFSVTWNSVPDVKGYMFECVPESLHALDQRVVSGGALLHIPAEKNDLTIDVSGWSDGSYQWRMSTIDSEGNVVSPALWRQMFVKNRRAQ